MLTGVRRGRARMPAVQREIVVSRAARRIVSARVEASILIGHGGAIPEAGASEAVGSWRLAVGESGWTTGMCEHALVLRRTLPPASAALRRGKSVAAQHERYEAV